MKYVCHYCGQILTRTFIVSFRLRVLACSRPECQLALRKSTSIPNKRVRDD